MSLELPLFTMASQMNISYTTNNTECAFFYNTTCMILDQTVVNSLCSDPSNTFNFVRNTTENQDYISTSIALMSIYFYGPDFNTANAFYYSRFEALTGWNINDINYYFRAPGTGMAGFAAAIQSQVYNWYSQSLAYPDLLTPTQTCELH
jgi:hypothetical protein